MTDRPIGERFTRLYRERGDSLPDSSRARHRIQRWVLSEISYDARKSISGFVGREMGISFGSNIPLVELDRDDFLDAVTVICQALRAQSSPSTAKYLATFAARVFTEENLGFEVDQMGGVHYRVDTEFVRNLQSVIAGLQQTRFTQATASLGQVQPALDRGDTRAAIRHAFDTAENVFKVILGQRVQRLGADEIRNHLRPRLEEKYEGAAKHATLKLADGFQDWTSSAHFYRHVEGTEDAPAPPDELAILLISQGASWARWLVSIEPQPAESKTPPG